MRFALVALVLLVSGCASQPNRQVSAEEAFSGVTDARSFWVRENDFASRRYEGKLANAPMAVKECVADYAVMTSSPALSAAVDRFLVEKTDSNYDRIVEMAFAQGNAEEVGRRAFVSCRHLL